MDGARTTREKCDVKPARTGPCPGHSLGGRGHLLPPEATVRASVCLRWRGRHPVGVHPEGSYPFKWTTVCLGGRTSTSLLLGFLFIFNADWSAGKRTCFTLTEPPGHRDVASVLAGTAPPRSAPCTGQAWCAKNSRSPWHPGGPFKSERRGGGCWGSCVCWQHSGCGRGHRLGI